MNRVQVVLPGFSVRLLFVVHAKSVGMVVCIILAALMLVHIL